MTSASNTFSFSQVVLNHAIQVMVLRLWVSLKASSLMVFNAWGRVMVFSESHQEKHPKDIFSRLSERLMSLSLRQPEKAW